MEERIVIVDEHNSPIGDEKKSVVHREGIWHRTVHIYYIRKRSGGFDFLVHLRAKNKTHCPNMWDTRFGGHVKSTQSILEAAQDKMREEVGLTMEPSELIEGPVTRSVSHQGTNREFNYIFFYQGTEDTRQLVFEDDEVQEVKWMSDKEIACSIENEPDVWAGSLETFQNVLASARLLC
ncbi:MAG: NUDIX family hydrolase [Parcubacteria group bacterium GW2011_GWA2_56_7]|nr:MAG: NUDIX family hydrolase [Parcubacteria group bacterium GW2011_GWA2_56_7]